jgi:hypothetical protein
MIYRYLFSPGAAQVQPPERTAQRRRRARRETAPAGR